jgi:hypothetical protein
MGAPFAQALKEAPESIRPFLVGTLWTRERLWALELPVVSIAVVDLEPLLELPWWTDGDRRFCLSPATVLARPGLHVDHDRRIAEADMGFPLHLTRLDGRLTILDGVHRLARAVHECRTEIAAQLVPASLLGSLADPDRDALVTRRD